MYVGAKNLDEEEVEVTALQHRPGEAAEQAVVGEPSQGTAQPQGGSAGEPTVEQESQVEQEQAADQVHVQPQVDAEGVLRPELLVTAPGGSRKGGGHGAEGAPTYWGGPQQALTSGRGEGHPFPKA